ncbi:hypothetical protein CFC21_046947 [Triticum aestivum]|uniref:Calcineurin-like phosphoesterase domain-containing protein n=4 Tax=Triticum TaxID=4564 RepID=A0A3B6AYI4_WHEAT|nr:hypothetical protein CFC21_046947 [Triticum aestivum]
MVITSSAPGIRLQGNIGKITSTALARQQNCKRLLPNRSISTDLLRICGSLLPLPLLLPPTLSSRARGNDAGEMAPPRTVICVGDVHGYISKLESLWANLQSALPADAFAAALVIFLGDYNDRGPDTRRVLDFLLALPARHPAQRHVFLCGNHDLAFAAFVGALPPPPDGSPFAATWDQYIDNEAHEGWFRGPGHEDMHVQGRRWGGVIKERWNPKKGLPYKGSIYDAQPTFESYGVAHGSPDLMKAVPEEHKKFLHDLVWVHEEEDVRIDTDGGQILCKLIAVHAGLEKSLDLNEQLRVLRTRDTRVPKVQMLSGRQDVWNIPQDLAGKQTIVVSGHHGKLHVDGLRFIIDEGGGYADKPIAAVVFPSKEVIRSTEGTASQN